MEVTHEPRNVRLVSGPVRVVEEWVNEHWDDYVILSYAWSVICDAQHVTVTAILKTEVEKAMRMQQLAMTGMQAGGRRQ
jgi:hypothetical protein